MTVGWHPDLRRLLAESDPDSVMLVQHKASVPVAAWQSTNVALIGDALHSMPPVGGLGGNAALRDANLLYRTLTAVRDGQTVLVPALHRYEAEMRASGYAAVHTALHTQGQGLRSNHIAVAGARAWFRACHAVPQLKRLNLAYRAQARPRPWERVNETRLSVWAPRRYAARTGVRGHEFTSLGGGRSASAAGGATRRATLTFPSLPEPQPYEPRFRR